MSTEDNLNSIYLSVRASLARMVSQIAPPKEVEDIVQETYVRVCQVKQKDDIVHPRSFLLKTARNLALDYLKRSETRKTVGMEEDFEIDHNILNKPSDEIYNQVVIEEEFAHFCEAVRQLPVQCRRVFVLKKVYGYSQREIAQELNISENTVEKHIGNGIKRCTYFMILQSQDNTDKRAHQPHPSTPGKGGRL